MIYPQLKNTPIKEIIFSISYEEIVDKDCFDKFVNLDSIKNNFNDIKPSVTNEFEVSNGGVRILKDNSGFHLRNKNEVLQMRKGSLSYHHLNSYRGFGEILTSLLEYWEIFDQITKDNLTITNISVRYINVIEIDKSNPASHLVQLYPKQSDDREVLNFQSSVRFSYKDNSDFIVNAVSTKPKEDIVLLDISVSSKLKPFGENKIDLEKQFLPLQNIKNRAFFDSITAKALIKYINQEN
ncbi:TIGR04255 family protein [Flavobacterium terrae]|uniref:TIGR04255 family protein n=1 Tax=Flavobacterium terrae TaxID=415425 RepID=A0A1M6AML0_9FLAO|nr:TIGR04255 family protein [Flavobacterium terrae]SHI37702.1 TIGR04255 family protein [Flavobacterium terrae]